MSKKKIPEPTHTPGTWKAQYEGEGAYTIDSELFPGGKWSAVANCQSNSLGSRIVSFAEAKANARLLAAAPDLLDALYRALPFVEDALTDEAYKKGAVKKVEKQIRDAIAKADGE